MIPAPEIEEVRVKVSVWLKLIVLLPDPKAIVGVVIYPAPSLPPREPIFRVPTEPLLEAIVIPLPAKTDAPLATVSVPLPNNAIVRLLEFDQMELLPVTRTELLKALL